VQNANEDDLCLLKAVSSAGTKKDISFVDAGKRQTVSILSPPSFASSHPPGYQAFPTRDGKELVSKIGECFKTKVGEANCATDDLRLFLHLYLKSAKEFAEKKEDHMRDHADGANSDGQYHVDNQQKGSKLPIREVTQVGPDMVLELKPVYLVPDSGTSKGYRTIEILKKGAIIPLPGVCKYALSFLGSGRGPIGLAWLDGKLVLVVLFHSIRSAPGADNLRRIMVAQELHPRSKDDHDRIFDDWGRGKLPSPFSCLLSSEDAQNVSAASIMSDLGLIEPFSPEDTVKCRTKGCHRQGSNLVSSDGGDIAFATMQSTNGKPKDHISGHVVCDGHVPQDSDVLPLCSCQKGVVLASMKTCATCNGGRCNGRPSENGGREYHCRNRTAEDIEDDVGVQLDETNIPPGRSARLCTDCAHPNCIVEGCKAAAKTGGVCIRHGGGKRCIVEGCKAAAKTGGLCIRHGGGKRCKVEGCKKGAISGGNLCSRHGGGKRCMVDGCEKGAVTGGKPDLCIAHGGGKRCNHQGCTKIAQSGQKKKGFCKKHGGGKK